VYDPNAVVEAHSDAVWRTVYRLVNIREDALDCYQQTFLDALRISDSGDIRYWRTILQRIATRRAIDRLRRRYCDKDVLTELRQGPAGRSAVEPPDARSQGEELREQVRRALATRPPQQAEAFWLRHIEQLPPNEISELMEVKPEHARILVHRAAIGLRALLGPTYGPRPISGEKQ
jgi:RNA polymerase sigma-70 factor, ECF subfamily